MTRRQLMDAIVTRLDDEAQRGGIYVKCLELMGDEDTEYPEVVDPCFDWGWFYVPDIGEEVEIEVVVADEQAEDVNGQAFLESGSVRWRNKRYHSEEGEAPRLPDPLFSSKNYGKRRGFATPQGHIFLFDDTEDDKQIMLAWKKTLDGTDYTQLTMDKDGSILAMTYNGMMLHLNATEGSEGITMLDKHGNMLATRDAGVVCNDLFGNIISLEDGVMNIIGVGDINMQAAKAVTINSAGSGNKVKMEMKDDGELNIDAETDANLTVGGNLTATVTGDALVECADATIDADTYNLGKGADSPLVRWTELNAWLDAHTHPTAFGPSGPPIVPSVSMGIDSTVGTLK